MTSAPHRDRDLQREVDALDSETLRWLLDAHAYIKNYMFPGVVVSVVLVIAGFVTLVIAAFGVSHNSYVALQMPYLVSNGFGGIGLIVSGCALAGIAGNRRDAALLDEDFKQVTDELTALSRTVIERRASAIEKGRR